MEDTVGDHTISCRKSDVDNTWSVYVTCNNLVESLIILNNYLEKLGKHINLLGNNQLGVTFSDMDDIKLENEYLDCSNGTYKTFSYAKMVGYGMAGVLNDKNWLDRNFVPEDEMFLEDL